MERWLIAPHPPQEAFREIYEEQDSAEELIAFLNSLPPVEDLPPLYDLEFDDAGLELATAQLHRGDLLPPIEDLPPLCDFNFDDAEFEMDTTQQHGGELE